MSDVTTHNCRLNKWNLQVCRNLKHFSWKKLWREFSSTGADSAAVWFNWTDFTCLELLQPIRTQHRWNGVYLTCWTLQICVCVCVCVCVGSRLQGNFAALAGGSARPLSEESRWTHRFRPGASVPTRTRSAPLPPRSTLSSAIFGGVDINICERVSPWNLRGTFETGRQFLFQSHQELAISLRRRLNLSSFGFSQQFVCLQPAEGSKRSVRKQLKHEISNHSEVKRL